MKDKKTTESALFQMKCVLTLLIFFFFSCSSPLVCQYSTDFIPPCPYKSLLVLFLLCCQDLLQGFLLYSCVYPFLFFFSQSQNQIDATFVFQSMVFK